MYAAHFSEERDNYSRNNTDTTNKSFGGNLDVHIKLLDQNKSQVDERINSNTLSSDI